jgi:RNA polymerase sigma-70 factor (ECF subfamily)
MAGYDERGKLKSWIFKIASNLIMDYFRKIKPMQFNVNTQLEDKKVIAPIDDLIIKENKQKIGLALDNLNAADKQVIYLRHYAGMSFKEISSMLGLPIGTVLAKANRSLKKLQILLEGNNA